MSEDCHDSNNYPPEHTCRFDPAARCAACEWWAPHRKQAAPYAHYVGADIQPEEVFHLMLDDNDRNWLKGLHIAL